MASQASPRSNVVPLSRRRTQRVAYYSELQTHREALGWTIFELQAKLEGTVSERSIRRLEAGYGIRPVSVHKIFNAISKHYPEPLVRAECVKTERPK